MPSHIGIVHGPAGSSRSGGATRGAGAIAIFSEGGGRLGIATFDVFDIVRGQSRVADTEPAARPRDPELDLSRLAALLQIGAMPAHAVIQQPSPRANQAASRIFASAQAHGAVLGVLAALRIPVTQVYAAVWRRDIGVSGGGGVADSGADAILTRASEVFPDHAGKWQRPREISCAYAALLAEWGRRQALATGSVVRAGQASARNSAPGWIGDPPAHGIAPAHAKAGGAMIEPAAVPHRALGSARRIIRHVSARDGIGEDTLFGPSRRDYEVATCRHVCMWLVHALLGYSCPRMAVLFRRDHSTVWHGVKRIEVDTRLKRRALALMKDFA